MEEEVVETRFHSEREREKEEKQEEYKVEDNKRKRKKMNHAPRKPIRDKNSVNYSKRSAKSLSTTPSQFQKRISSKW